jgi:hypothetical protein
LGVLRSRYAKATAFTPHFESFGALGLALLVYHNDFNFAKTLYIAIVDVGEPVAEVLTRASLVTKCEKVFAHLANQHQLAHVSDSNGGVVR